MVLEGGGDVSKIWSGKDGPRMEHKRAKVDEMKGSPEVEEEAQRYVGARL